MQTIRKKSEQIIFLIEEMGIQPESLAAFLEECIEMNEATAGVSSQVWSPERLRQIKEAKLLMYLLRRL